MLLHLARVPVTLLYLPCPRRLFYAGFLGERSRSEYARSARDHIGALAAAHPWVVSTVIRLLHAHFGKVGKVAIFLIRALPLHKWEPTGADAAIIRLWLESPFQSPEHLVCDSV